MTKFLPIFPLNTVVFPRQTLNLHIFEPRYKQLIKECVENGNTFGIPSVVGENLSEYGTEIELIEVVKEYENGELDVSTRGVKPFRIIELLREVPDKLYSAAIVYDLEILSDDVERLHPELIRLIKNFHELVGIQVDVFSKFTHPLSYELAPYIAMNAEDQTRLLATPTERARQMFMVQHLEKLIPTLLETNKVIERISMNGHFRNEIPPSF